MNCVGPKLLDDPDFLNELYDRGYIRMEQIMAFASDRISNNLGLLEDARAKYIKGSMLFRRRGIHWH